MCWSILSLTQLSVRVYIDNVLFVFFYFYDITIFAILLIRILGGLGIFLLYSVILIRNKDLQLEHSIE